MLNIIEQDIDLVLPSSHVRMVLMQPFVHFERPYTEPYKWRDAKKAGQLQAIQRTLQIANPADDRSHSHFTIFPEYAIPGVDGVRTIDEAIQSREWPIDTVIIGGVDGLSQNEYSELCRMDDTEFDQCNAPQNIGNTEWVNSVITWTKDNQGNLRKWVQPKLEPSEIERNTPCQNMFHGRSVYIFKIKFDNDVPCRFFSMVCFDWIAAINGISTQSLILSELNRRWGNSDPKSIHWVFVIQQNPKPNDRDFLVNTETFLLDHQDYQFVHKRFASVVLANNALQDGSCGREEGGFTSFVYEPNSPFVWDECRPTVSVCYNRYRDNGGFTRCRDVTFREMGPCIQCANVTVVPWLGARTRDRCSAIDGGSVYPLQTPCLDPRLPEKPVPASVKWVNDELDSIPLLSDGAMNCRPLEPQVQHSQTSVTDKYREIEEHILNNFVRLSTWIDSETLNQLRKQPFENADFWEKIEQEGLKHTVYVLSLLRLCHNTEVSGSVFHGTIQTPDGLLNIVAVRGPTHEECRKHFDHMVVASGSDPVIFVTHDEENLIPTEDELKKIYEVTGDTRLRHMAYAVLIDKCRQAASVQLLRGALADIFRSEDEKFI